VVDDSIAARRWLSRSLERAGYQVVQCGNGQEAMNRLNHGFRCHLVICDIEMPRLDGFQVLQQIRQHPALHTLPVAMLTSRHGDRHLQQAMKLGANAYFTKPPNIQHLLQSLENLLG
jgi:two-component system, chemotaxis family, sensor histidine kinase and response regulator PixL